LPDLTPTSTILLSPAAGGKTERLVQLLVSDPQSIRPRWAVLPDRVQVSTFRRRIAQAGGALGVSVGTFGDLYQEILARAGRAVAVTPGPARQRILRLAIRQLEKDSELPFYQPIARTPGLLTAVGDAIAELKRARVAPEAVGRLERPSMREIALIYGEFQRRLQPIPWTDREGLNELAIQALGKNPDLLADMPLIAVDGFDSFDAAQLEALAALAGQVEQLVVALPGSSEPGRAAFRRFARPLARLREALPDARLEELKDPIKLPEPMQALESGLFEADVAPIEADGVIEMIEARSPSDESREAMRWIKARLVRDRIALEDCAVIAPEATRYGPLLRRAAAEFGIRLRFTYGKPLNQAPSVSALMDLLELSRSNWPRRLTLQIVRSPYLDLTEWGLEPGDALKLDAASHAGQVVEGFDQWEQALTQLMQAEAAPEDENMEGDLPTFSAPKGESAERLLQALQAFSERLAPAPARPTSKWVEWLENLLDELEFPARTSDERDHPAFLRLRETLRALVLGEIVAGEMDLTYGEFLDDLHTAVEAATYREGQPLYEPAVNILGPLEARGGRYQAVVVMGLSEGLLPVVEREDPFLDEATRAALGLKSRLGLEQGGLFYQAVTRAGSNLLLTRSYLADDGEAWEPSPFWRSVEQMLADPPRRIRPEAPRPLQEAGSPQELIFWGVRRGGMPASLLEAHTHRWEQLQHAQQILRARGDPEPAGLYEGDLASEREELAGNFGPDHLWSPSRLETYGTCPHMFYTSYLLGLEAREPPTAGLDAAQLGLILHEVLEEVYAEADDPGHIESVLEALDRIVDPIMERAPEKYGFRPTPLWEIERNQHVEALRETVRALSEVGEGWTPSEFEMRFGFDPSAPLELAVDGKTVRVRGMIDRLDRREDGKLRVIDYKTGTGRLSVKELDEGRRIQLPLYALAARDALALGEVVEGFYWAILAAKRSSLRLSNYRAPEDAGGAGLEATTETAGGGVKTAKKSGGGGAQATTEKAGGGAKTAEKTGVVGPEAAYNTARRHVSRIVDGVQSGHFEPIPPPGGCPNYCPAAAWCWRYKPKSVGR
jgi:ATP-dependent helicase/DNAse subunit B